MSRSAPDSALLLPLGDAPADSEDAPDLEAPGAGRRVAWSWLGRRPYAPLLEVQEEIRRRLHRGEGPERLLLLEHDPVFTVGRNADEKDVLADDDWLLREGVEVHVTNRGGRVTYHGPGQLVGYPVICLKPDRRDVGRYVRDLQDVLIRVLADFGIEGRRRDGKDFIGVWVGKGKIASIGVHLSRWITIHGFALNVEPRLVHFDGIVACGLPGVQMTSMAEHLDEPPTPEELAPRVARHFAEVFERRLEEEALYEAGRAS